MIAKNELRIGNYISDIHASKLGIWQVTAIRNQTCNYGVFSARYEDLKPIPLDAELLEKCGFESNPIACFINITQLMYLFYTKKTKSFGIAIRNEDDDLSAVEELAEFLDIKHLHQLQNLFFILSGTELNYQP